MPASQGGTLQPLQNLKNQFGCSKNVLLGGVRPGMPPGVSKTVKSEVKLRSLGSIWTHFGTFLKSFLL